MAVDVGSGESTRSLRWRRASPGAAPAEDPVYAFTGAFFAALVASGVRHVAVSPGSRSTALALSASRAPGLRAWPIVDERSAGFFALGLARTARAPVALVCTSGTAAANYWPAVVEAHHARVPLVVLTADRPPELRDRGAGQTIDQLHLYGAYVRWFAELPVAGEPGATVAFARALAARAAAAALGPPAGAVHLNWPLREPLEPRGGVVAPDGAAAPPRVTRSRAAPDPDEVAALVELVRTRPRGVIACGPLDADADLAEAVARLARASGWPVIADPLSGLRRGPHASGTPILSAADLWLRDEAFAAARAPDAMLRLGGMPVSKAFRRWLERTPPEHAVLVDPDGVWADPIDATTWVVRGDAASLCRGAARRLEGRARGDSTGSGLGRALERADAAVRRRVEERLASTDAWCEPVAVRAVCDALPSDAVLFVANSMPVRDLDAVLPAGSAPLRVLCNRGANGIDGTISSALGATAASGRPCVLLTGDLAFLHDVGALLSARRLGLPLVIVVLDNDGGGIFSMLPVAESIGRDEFETWFRTPHGLDLERAGALFGIDGACVGDPASLRAEVEAGLASGAPRLVIARLDAEAGWALRRTLHADARAALRAGGAA